MRVTIGHAEHQAAFELRVYDVNRKSGKIQQGQSFYIPYHREDVLKSLQAELMQILSPPKKDGLLKRLLKALK